MMRHDLSKVFWKNGRPVSSVRAFIVQEPLGPISCFNNYCSGLSDVSFSYHICFSDCAYLLIFE